MGVFSSAAAGLALIPGWCKGSDAAGIDGVGCLVGLMGDAAVGGCGEVSGVGVFVGVGRNS